MQCFSWLIPECCVCDQGLWISPSALILRSSPSRSSMVSEGREMRVCLCVHTCVCLEMGKGEPEHPFETPSCSSLWCDGRAGAHTHHFFALINPCLTGKISKRIFKHLPYPLLMSLSWEGGKLGGSGGDEHQLWRHRCDNQQQHQKHFWHRHSGRTGSLISVFQIGGKCCAFVAGLPYVQMKVGVGGHQILFPPLWSLLPESVCWVLAFLVQKTKIHCDSYWLTLSLGACEKCCCLLPWEQRSLAGTMKGSLCPCMWGEGSFPQSSAKNEMLSGAKTGFGDYDSEGVWCRSQWPHRRNLV